VAIDLTPILTAGATGATGAIAGLLGYKGASIRAALNSGQR
jgi:hypothetical protein